MSKNLFSKPLNFSEYFEHVVNWNLIARNGVHDFSESTDSFQLELVVEEANELFEAYEKADKVMALDGLCDIFVTAAYKTFLEKGDKNWKPEIIISMPSASIDYAKQLKYSLYGLKEGRAVLNDVCALLYQFDGFVTGALSEVLASNDSKFPKVSVDPQNGVEGVCVPTEGNPEYHTPEDMCSWIERKSKGRYTGVGYIIVGEGNDRRYVFKSDKGKIVKPATFFEPNLSQYC